MDNNETEDISDVIIPLVVFVLIIVFIGWMMYLLIKSGFQNTDSNNRVNTDERENETETCAIGQCATNLLSGFKSCPVNDVAININPSIEVCNSRYVCDNPLTPYALQSDGSTNINGVCEPGVECGCLRVLQCPEYILSVFTTNNGNPYSALNGQRLTFPQQSTYTNTSGEITTNTPIQYNNPSTTFCTAPPSWLPISTPGCNFISIADSNSITYDDLLLCMGQINGCSGLMGSPCLQGTLAFVTNNPETLTQTNFINGQLACVSGQSCPCGLAAIYDTNLGNIICMELPSTT